MGFRESTVNSTAGRSGGTAASVEVGSPAFHHTTCQLTRAVRYLGGRPTAAGSQKRKSVRISLKHNLEFPHKSKPLSPSVRTPLAR
jgi:hypothetical protein